MAQMQQSQDGCQWASIGQPVVPTKDVQAARDQPSATSIKPGNGEVHIGDVIPNDERVVLYVIKADRTSYINYIKPLILAEELQIPHLISVIDTKTEWARTIHPERMVPALCDHDPETKEIVRVFEGTACIQYLADRFDSARSWTGKTAKERGAIFSWTAYQTAGIGATAKYWLYFSAGYPTRTDPVKLPRTIEKLHANTVAQWDILEQRLSIPGQRYIALPDRPTLADLSYFPFAMPWMFKFLGVDMDLYPKTQEWASEMLKRPAVKKVMEYAPTLGHTD